MVTRTRGVPLGFHSRELLTRAIAYRIQEQAFGGLKPATRKLLERLATDADRDLYRIR